MMGKELISYIKKFSYIWGKFGGIYSIDELDYLTPEKGKFYICNTDRIFNKGKHWIVIFWDIISNNIEYFDSLGKFPLNNFIIFMKKSKKKIIYNTRRIQNLNSDTCGYFCLYFIVLRCNSITFKQITNHFSNDLINNEKHVQSFINQSINKKIII